MKRLNYSVLNAKYSKIGKGNVRLTQSSLFLTKPINQTVTSYTFDVLETQTQSLQNDEIRLNINDEFNITEIGLYLVGYIGDRTSDTFNPNTKLFTYAPFHLSLADATKLQSFYAGTFKIAINNIVFMEKWDTAKHEIVTRTQINPYKVGVDTTPVMAQEDSSDLSKDGIYPTANIITLSGAKKNDLTINLPNAIKPASFDYTDSNGVTVRAGITIDRVGVLLRGFNAQNAASFQR